MQERTQHQSSFHPNVAQSLPEFSESMQKKFKLKHFSIKPVEKKWAQRNNSNKKANNPIVHKSMENYVENVMKIWHLYLSQVFNLRNITVSSLVPNRSHVSSAVICSVKHKLLHVYHGLEELMSLKTDGWNTLTV